ncbi:MAG TPA: hypothetical protein VFC02_19175 [Anaerolineales bacterium]|nr:hypothetical protein [Anaerolineales bacterium]
MNSSRNHPPTRPRNGNGNKVSLRALFSLAMLVGSLMALGVSMLAGARIVFDLLAANSNIEGVATKMIVIVLAYGVGWITAVLATRVYHNLILPVLINWLTWGCLVIVCYLYLQILKRMYDQPEELIRFIKYLFAMAGGLTVLIGLHLIVEGHSLRLFSIPLLIISFFHLVLIVYRYVFAPQPKFDFLWKDLVFFILMATVSLLMLVHIGVLEPLRMQLTSFFDRYGQAIRAEN